QPPGPLARLVLEQVVPVRPAAHHLAGTGQPKPLPGPAVGLHLRHGRRLRLLRAGGAASPAPAGATSPTPPDRVSAQRCDILLPSSATPSQARPRGHPGARARAAPPLASAAGFAAGPALPRLVGRRCGGRAVPRGTLPRRRAVTMLRGPVGLGLALPSVRPDNHDHVTAVL